MLWCACCSLGIRWPANRLVSSRSKVGPSNRESGQTDCWLRCKLMRHVHTHLLLGFLYDQSSIRGNHGAKMRSHKKLEQIEKKQQNFLSKYEDWRQEDLKIELPIYTIESGFLKALIILFLILWSCKIEKFCKAKDFNSTSRDKFLNGDIRKGLGVARVLRIRWKRIDEDCLGRK